MKQKEVQKEVPLPDVGGEGLIRVDSEILANWRGNEAIHNSGLTPKEVQVLKLVATGLTTLDISKQLSIQPASVLFHYPHINSKLGVNSISEAVSKARAMGIIH